MKLMLVQERVRCDRFADNFERIQHTLNRDEAQAADLVVFPRLMLSGRLSPKMLSRPGVSIQYDKVWKDFVEFSAKHPRINIASSVLRFDAHGGVREEAFILRGGEDIYRCPKIIGSCDYPPERWPSFDFDGTRVRLVIGGDEKLPAASHDVDMLLTLNDHPFRGQVFSPPMSKEKGFWRINVSNVGGEGMYVYQGASYVFDPNGELKGWASGFDGTIILLDSQSSSLPTVKSEPASYIQTLHDAIVCGLKDFMRASGQSKAVIGLSGGIDSALVAVLAARALGPENVLNVAMPSEFNAPESLNLARALAEKIKTPFRVLPINSVKDAFHRSFFMMPPCDEKAGQLADENIQARIRSVFLMYLANREGRLLIGTTNKSEEAVGYSTLYGDTCGAVMPLGDVYKSGVYELARYVNRDEEIIPEDIISRAPSAELKIGQTDQDSLPPYEELDDILFRYFEGRQSGSRIAKEGGHSPLTVAWVLNLIKKSAFKRDQEPFSLVLSPEPLWGYDWR